MVKHCCMIGDDIGGMGGDSGRRRNNSGGMGVDLGGMAEDSEGDGR